jgi:hypothetical protein
MTVEELIEELMKIEDKSKIVYCDLDCGYNPEIVEEIDERAYEVFIR